MDVNRSAGPSRRHHISSSASTSTTPIFSESYFTVDSDDFDSSKPTSQQQQPFQSISGPSPPNSQFNTFNNSNNAFYAPVNNFSSPNIPPPVVGPSWQQFPGFQEPPIQTSQSSTSIFANQQFLMAAGQQLLSNPMTAAAIDAYSQSLVDKSKGWMYNIKQYFAVDTNYAFKKLMLIFLPFLHKDWSIRYNSENVVPREELNLPDLYIPSMAFITYILISGYILGLKNQFAPEQLGIYASSAFAWLLLEVFLILIAKYLLNLSSVFGFFHMIAFGGYKFVCVDVLLLISVIFGRNGYWFLFVYVTFSLGYFLLRALSTNFQMGQQSSYPSYDHNPRKVYYLVIFIALIQPIVMYFLTFTLITTTITVPPKYNM